MKDSQVLRKAKRKLTPEREFICWAIDDVVGATPEQVRRLTAWVMLMLDGYATYEGWMAAKHDKWFQKEDGPLLKGRKQWLDWMISYCEQEEAVQNERS